MKPCDRQGIAIEDIANAIVHDPERELSELHFLLRISNVKCVSPKYKVNKIEQLIILQNKAY